MRKLYASHDRVLVGYLASVLEEHRIPCVVKNDLLSGAAGELPPTECWPELWLADGGDFERARELVDAVLADPPRERPAWHCPACGEHMEGQFESCWHCGLERPDTPEE